MPTVYIQAFDAQHLPMLSITTWREEWSASTPGATWNPPDFQGNRAVIVVANLPLGTVESTVDPTIEDYNQTHPGNDSLTTSFLP